MCRHQEHAAAAAAAAAAKSLQLCPTLCNPRDGSPPASPIPGISYSHQDSMVLEQKQKYRQMEQDRKPRNKPMHLWLPYF